VRKPEPPTRIVFVSHSARAGGAELCLLELCEGLVGLLGVEVEVVLPAPGPLEQQLTGVGARVRVLRNFGWATARAPRSVGTALAVFNAAASLRLAAWLRRTSPDIVVTNSVINPAGAFAARMATVPHVWLVNEYGDLDHGYRFLLGLRRSLRAVDRLSARVLTCSHALARRVTEFIPAHKVEVAYYAVTHGLDRQPCPPRGRRGAPRALVLGRKHPGKGQLDALRAVHRLRQRGGEATLRVVGEAQGRYGRTLERFRAGPGRESGGVTLVPRVADAIDEIDACDVLLLCSRCEAFGRVVVEAMKRGRPVIATRAGGAEELVSSSGGGLLYPPGDDAALADAIERLGSDPAEAQRMGAAGRAWAERNCTLERYTRSFMAVATRALG
jgi:glycosyltransferase involved in cell wall biosynthesis